MTTAGIAFIVFAFAAAVTALISAVLYYHWVRYGTDVLGTIAIMIIYAIGTALLLLMLLGVTAQL
jgi:hypothetical protein